MDQQKTRRTLRYEFTNEEMRELGRDLSVKNQELRQLEEQKKSVVADFGSRMTIAKEHISSLSDKVASGYEMRDVMCMVEYHTPEINKKSYTRTDNSESWIEPMNDTDHNLFTQWEQRERERLETEASEIDNEINFEQQDEGDSGDAEQSDDTNSRAA